MSQVVAHTALRSSRQADHQRSPGLRQLPCHASRRSAGARTAAASSRGAALPPCRCLFHHAQQLALCCLSKPMLPTSACGCCCTAAWLGQWDIGFVAPMLWGLTEQSASVVSASPCRQRRRCRRSWRGRRAPRRACQRRWRRGSTQPAMRSAPSWPAACPTRQTSPPPAPAQQLQQQQRCAPLSPVHTGRPPARQTK